jgi:hypothetical protein
VVSVKESSLLRDVANFWEGTVMKPPTPRFFPIFSGHFDTHFAFLCFQPQNHQPQRSGSQPQRSGSPPPATKTGSLTTCHHVSLQMRLLYIQLSETDTLLFSPHTFFTCSCLRQTRPYSRSTPSLLNSCLRQTHFLFSLHIISIHSCTSLLSDICAPLLCHENTY